MGLVPDALFKTACWACNCDTIYGILGSGGAQVTTKSTTNMQPACN